jgi:hypothetical protein
LHPLFLTRLSPHFSWLSKAPYCDVVVDFTSPESSLVPSVHWVNNRQAADIAAIVITVLIKNYFGLDFSTKFTNFSFMQLKKLSTLVVMISLTNRIVRF